VIEAVRIWWNHPKPVEPIQVSRIRSDLAQLGIRLDLGLKSALIRLPEEQYQGLLSLLAAVSADVKIDYSLRLPALGLILGGPHGLPIEFSKLATPAHVSRIVDEFFDYRTQTLDLMLLPAYLRKVRQG
jgi:hypothetical protein